MTKEVGSDTTKFEDKPAHLVALNIYAQLPLNIRIDIFNNFVSGRYSASFDTAEFQELDGFYLLNLRAEMKIFSDLFIFANANNLTNSYYETVHGFPAEGRNFSLGIRYSYK